MDTAYTRPARPAHIDDELTEEAERLFGMKRRQFASVVRTDHGLVLTTVDGARTIYATVPDALGQTGILYYPTPGRPTPKRMAIGIWADPTEGDPLQAETSGEAWTVADLDLAASRVRGTPPTGGPALMSWINEGENPGERAVRARAGWLWIARRRGYAPRAVAARIGEVKACREIVLSSNLLDPDEAATL